MKPALLAHRVRRRDPQDMPGSPRHGAGKQRQSKPGHRPRIPAVGTDHLVQGAKRHAAGLKQSIHGLNAEGEAGGQRAILLNRSAGAWRILPRASSLKAGRPLLE